MTELLQLPLLSAKAKAKHKLIVKPSRKKTKEYKVSHIGKHQIRDELRLEAQTNQALYASLQFQYWQRWTVKRTVGYFIKDLWVRIDYSSYTYLCCLELLRRLNFYDWSLCRIAAAAIFSIISKSNESKIPSFFAYVIWSQGEFNQAQLSQAEGQILIGIDFQLPVFNLNYEWDIQMACLQLQQSFCL